MVLVITLKEVRNDKNNEDNYLKAEIPCSHIDVQAVMVFYI